MKYLQSTPFSVSTGGSRLTDFEYAVAVGSIPAGIFRVVIDKGVLAGFKARALRAYPVEYAETLWGFVENGTAYVASMERADAEADEGAVEIDSPEDFGDVLGGQTLMGTIHTHPDDTNEPSETDFAESQATKEWVFGVCAINKVNGRRYVSYAFFLPDGKQLEFAISEEDKRKARCTATE